MPKQYKRNVSFSYAIGVFATLELLKHQRKQTVRVYISSHGSSNSGLAKILEICNEYHVPTETADAVIRNISKSENCYAVGVFNKYQTVLEKGANHVILVSPSDMGNTGTIIRTMVGFGKRNLAIIKPAVDVFDPKVIRASQGAIFQTNIEYLDNFVDYTKKFSIRSLYPFLTNGRRTIQDISFQQPYSLVFGNEGAGLGKEFEEIGTSVSIPHSTSIDSLNIAIAAGIALYEAINQ